MKNSISFIIASMLVYSCVAQVTITAGAQFYVNGNAQLTLQNTDLVNNGNFAAGNGTVSFTGNASSTISGSQPVQFYHLEINKSGGNIVSLQRLIDVSNQINFTSGFLDLNGNNINLGNTGLLNGEQESSRIIGANGGQVLFNTFLNAPVAANPGNLGAIISSTLDLGNVTIARGHKSQVNGLGNGNSILRYYDITPSNNSGLGATVQFQYFDGELNGLTEGSLVLVSSPDNTTWTNEGTSSTNSTLNYIIKSGITSFSRLTLSDFTNALPVNFIAFNAQCEGNSVLINWKTAQEQNSSHYNIERSLNNIEWAVIGKVPAAGISNTINSYFFRDNHPVPNNYYRIAEYDLDGKLQYSNTIKSTCNVSGNTFIFWPNPTKEDVFINLAVNRNSQALIKVFDSKGALIKMQKENLLTGSNQLHINIKNLASGIYHFAIEWNNGKNTKAMQVFKE